MKHLKIKTATSQYPIIIGQNVLKNLKPSIKKYIPNAKKVLIIFDNKIPSFYKKNIILNSQHLKTHHLSLKVSENIKSFKFANHLAEKCLELNLNRNDLLIAVGGGVIGDLCAFVASIVKRGINFVNLPSTILSQVDSSIGGKTGVNSHKGKNMIGSFYEPKFVLSEVNLLKSLPKREIICGYAEIIKHAIIKDKKFFSWLKIYSKSILSLNNDRILIEAIYKSCKIKKYFVEKDFKENNLRMTLNFGHTFAHGIETMNNYKKINHGEAVLAGMMLALKLSKYKKICDSNSYLQIYNIYKENKLNYPYLKFIKPNNIKKLVKFMMKDKKNFNQKINLILLKKIGLTTKPDTQSLEPAKLLKYLQKII